MYRYLYQPGEQHRDKKYKQLTLSEVKMHIGPTKLSKTQVNAFCTPDKAVVHEKLMYIPKDTQVLPEWLSIWK